MASRFSILRSLLQRGRQVVLLATALGVTACSESAGPDQADLDQPKAGSFHQHLRWAAPPAADDFSAVANLPVGPVALEPHQPPQALFDGNRHGWDGLDVFSVSFFAVRGEAREVRVRLESDSGNDEFLRLQITEPTVRPDGSPIAEGDSVLITVTIDPISLAVDLQPSGIQFGSNDPTELDLSYEAAGLDLNVDGSVNAFDDYIEQNLLGIWMQEHPGDPWVFLEEHDHSGKKFEVILEHFSEYAVSW